MSAEGFVWLLMMSSAAPINNTNEARLKGEALIWLSDQIEASQSPEDAESIQQP